MSQPSLARGYVFAGMTVVIWTGFILVARLGGIGRMTPFDIVAVRLATAACLLVPLWLWRGRPPILSRRVAILALWSGPGYTVMVYAAFHLAPAAHGGILLSGAQPFAMALVVWLLLGEKPTPRRQAGIALIGVGAALLTSSVLGDGGDTWIGDAMFVCASLCWSVYVVLARRWGMGAWEVTINVGLLSAAAYLPVYLIALPKTILSASWGEIALQAAYQGALAAVIQMIIYMRAVEILGPSRMGVLAALVPGLGAILAVPLLDEPLTPALVASLALVSTGVLVGNAGADTFTRRKTCPT